MKAIDLAKQLLPDLSRQEIIGLSCPDVLGIENDCEKNRLFVDDECVKCWDKEVKDPAKIIKEWKRKVKEC